MPWLTILVAGLTVGSIYGLYGLGVTLIYKATRVPNFAHAAFGMFGAYLFFKTWDRSQHRLLVKRVMFRVPFTHGHGLKFVPPALPMWAALLLALGGCALLGLATARLMRLLTGASTVLLIVATLGLLEVLIGFIADIFGVKGEVVPKVVAETPHKIGRLRFNNFDVVIVIVPLVLALLLGLFFRRTTLGIAIRATADSREVSRLLGINANAVSSFAWAVGSMLACIAAVLVTPRVELDQIFLFTLIVPGFAAALFGGFTSLMGTFLGGLFLGIIEQGVIAAPWPHGVLGQLFTKQGTGQFVAFLAVVGVLMARPKFIFKGVRVEEESGVGVARIGGALGPEDLLRKQLDRAKALPILLHDWTAGKYVLGGLLLLGLLAVPMFAVSYWSAVLCIGVIDAVIALSVVVLTGWTGQVSMAPLTFAGAGAWGACIAAASWHLPFWAAILMGGVVGIPIALIVGIPALRLRGFFLAIATMAFALACQTWLFTLPQLTTRNKFPRGMLREEITQPTFLVALFIAALLFWGIRNLSKTRIMRAWNALRDSENTAVAMGVDPVRYKLLAFVLSGFLAGVGGGLFACLNRVLNAPSFSLDFSLAFVLFAFLAGVGEIFGAFLVGVFQVTPALFANTATGINQFTVILPGILAILTVIQYPNGLAAFYRRLVRPFDVSERVAWASAEEEGDTSGAAAVAASETEISIAVVAESLAEEAVIANA